MEEHISMTIDLPLLPMVYRGRVQNEGMSGFQHDNPIIWKKQEGANKMSKRF